MGAQAHTFASNIWASTNAWRETFTYDANGNINNASRWNQAVQVDNLTYQYRNNTNQLAQITDTFGANLQNDDVDNQNDGNYQYDEIGNLTSDASEGIDTIGWTVYGKVARVVKTVNGQRRVTTYHYDGTGNRVMKVSDTRTTYYVRDASGNVMAIYEKQNSQTQVTLTEQPIYGSSRIGVYRGGIGKFQRILGNKVYEISNHLGNVLATISDNKTYLNNNTSSPRVVSASDYYAFGAIMSSRSYQDPTYQQRYRYGFNGKEKSEGDDFYDFEARSYYEKIGRFISVDPRFKQLPAQSPYNYSLNNPLMYVDSEGELPILVWFLGQIAKKYGEGVAADLIIQMVGAYFFGDAQNLSDAWEQVNLGEALKAGGENLISNKHASAIYSAIVNVIEYYQSEENPTKEGAAAIAFQGALGSYIEHYIGQYGEVAVAAGLKKLGLGKLVRKAVDKMTGMDKINESLAEIKKEGKEMGLDLDNVSIDANKKEVENFDIVNYGVKSSPFENHHGVLDVWAKENITGYVSRASDNPTIALTPEQHEATKRVYRDWLQEKTGKRVGGKINWKNIGVKEVKELTERMFNAANVPQDKRDEYYKSFNKYIYGK